jgi:hypothetical protein
MTLAAEDPVASGQDYLIIEVNHRPPDSLIDFTGEVEIKLARGGTSLSVMGEGAEVDGAVRLCQKDRGPAHRDVRVWTVTDRRDGTFTAAPFAAF